MLDECLGNNLIDVYGRNDIVKLLFGKLISAEYVKKLLPIWDSVW
jgi:hypothetical protein